MATTQDPQAPAPSGIAKAKEIRHRYLWTKDEYRRLDRLGIFQDRRVELLGGDFYLMTVKPPHCVSVELTRDALVIAFGPGFYVRSQGTLDLGLRSQPMPDVAVVPGQPRDYVAHHPTTALLVVEVSETTLHFDRERKMRRYAQAQIADYWIVNLIERQLEVYRNPGPDPSRPDRFLYLQKTIIPASGSVSLLAAPHAVVAVARLLP